MPGGKVAPDGRPAQAPGVGAQSKRHDLEMPGTPGLHGSDLQQGDVQMLEQGQRVAPRPKRTQPPAAPKGRQGSQERSSQSPGNMAVPDPLEMAGNRYGGNAPMAGSQMRQVDASAWRPLVEMMAYSPNSGGTLAASLADSLSQFVRRPIVSEVSFVDVDGADRILGG